MALPASRKLSAICDKITSISPAIASGLALMRRWSASAMPSSVKPASRAASSSCALKPWAVKRAW